MIDDSTRVQLQLRPIAFARLQRLKDITEAASYSEVLRNALIHYEAMLTNGSDHVNGVSVGVEALNKTDAL